MYKILQFQLTLIIAYLIINFSPISLAKPQNQTSDVPESSEEKTKINPTLNENTTISVKGKDWDDDWHHGHGHGNGCGSHGCHGHGGHNSGWNPTTGSDVWTHYHNILGRCLHYNGVPREVQQAVRKCKGDSRAERNFDCFVLCVYKEVGIVSPVHISGNTYYTDNYHCFNNIINEVLSEDRCTKADLFITIQNCKTLLNTRGGWFGFSSPSPPHGLYPDLDNCGALHGVFKCGYISFFQLHNCHHRREDKDWLLATKRNMTENTETEKIENDSNVELKKLA